MLKQLILAAGPRVLGLVTKNRVTSLVGVAVFIYQVITSPELRDLAAAVHQMMPSFIAFVALLLAKDPGLSDVLPPRK